jgi:hypothetical protein
MRGLRKGIISVMPLQNIEVDCLAGHPCDALMHSHRQPHMGDECMQLTRCAG